MPPEVLIAILLPIRKPEIIFRQMSCGLEETFVSLANPSLKAAYKIKLNLECMQVAVMIWGDIHECSGLLAWMGENDITFIDNVEILENLSDLHNYCHGRQQQMNDLHREAAENAVDLQSAFADMKELNPIASSSPLSQMDTGHTTQIQENNNSTLIDSTEDAIGIDNAIINAGSELNWIKSARGRDKLSYCGFIYNFQRKTSTKVQWRCQVKNCRGRIHTFATSALKILGQHSHGEEIGKAEVIAFRACVKRHALVSNDNPHRIIAEESRMLSNFAKTLLPCEKSLKKICQRVRPTPTNPTNLFDLYVDQNIQTLSGNNFLLYDSGPGINRIVMFSTAENKKILSFSKIWMADGTFKTVPSLFSQLYTIHALVGGMYPFRDGHLLPSIYVLLPGKITKHYREMWKVIKQMCPDANPDYLLVDFERGSINAFKEVWPMTHVKGCFFHLSQSVYRKVQELGLTTIYTHSTEVALTIRMLPALAYLPPEIVLSAFQILESQFTPEIVALYKYFQTTYVGYNDQFGMYTPPLFPISMWNNFHLVAYGIPTTTNSVEAWHRAFSVTVACYHPTFWKFCEALKIEQSSVELRQAQYYSGSSPNKSKTSLQKISKIVRLVMNYHTRPLQTYLQSIAYNVSL